MPSSICDFCGKMPKDFSSQRMFLEHYKEHKGLEYKCDVCDDAFSTKQSIGHTNIFSVRNVTSYFLIILI